MKRLLDKNGRLFGVVSVIDVIVILLVILLTAGVYLRFFVMEKTATATPSDAISYKVVIECVRDYTVSGLREGDVLYDTTSGAAIGTVTAVDAAGAQSASSLLDGSYVMAPMEDRYDVTLTLEARGLVSGGRYYINRTYEIGANVQRTFNTKYVSFRGTVTEIG